MDQARELFGLLLRAPARGLVRWGFGTKVQVDPEISKLQGVVIVCNHPSVLDPPMLFGRLPKRTWFTGTEKVMLRYPLLRVMRALPVVFFPASGLRKHEMAKMQAVASLGKNLVVFPQGDCVHPDGPFTCFPGFYRVAKRTKRPMAFVAIDGTHRVFDWEHDRRIKRGHTVRLRLFGQLEPTASEDEAVGMFRRMIESLRTTP